jgi:hypothetical protein
MTASQRSPPPMIRCSKLSPPRPGLSHRLSDALAVSPARSRLTRNMPRARAHDWSTRLIPSRSSARSVQQADVPVRPRCDQLAGLPVFGAASRRTSCATPTRSSWLARASRSTSSSASWGTPTWHHVYLPPRNRPRGDHRRPPSATRPDDVGERRAATLSDLIARRGRPGAPASPDAARASAPRPPAPARVVGRP